MSRWTNGEQAVKDVVGNAVSGQPVPSRFNAAIVIALFTTIYFKNMTDI